MRWAPGRPTDTCAIAKSPAAGTGPTSGACMRYLELHGAHLEVDEVEELVRVVLNIIDDPLMAPCLATVRARKSRSSGRIDTLNGPRAIVGRIDRVAELPGQVLLADFETGDPATHPAPRNYCNSRSIAQPPCRFIQARRYAACGFTQDASIVEPSEAALEEALRRIGGENRSCVIPGR